MTVDRAEEAELERMRQLIQAWADKELVDNPLLIAVDRDGDRWYLRMTGEDKTITTIWLTLRERTVFFETYFMPAPEENIEECFEFLLRVNPRMFAWRFAIGLEDAVYLVGQLPTKTVDEEELDRIVGSGWAYSEEYFRSAMSIGYRSRYRPPKR